MVRRAIPQEIISKRTFEPIMEENVKVVQIMDETVTHEIPQGENCESCADHGRLCGRANREYAPSPDGGDEYVEHSVEQIVDVPAQQILRAVSQTKGMPARVRLREPIVDTPSCQKSLQT